MKTYDYFKGGIPWQRRWSDRTIPSENRTYLKITPDKFIAITYGCILVNFGIDIKEKLECIQVALRDGEAEYQLFDREVERLQEERSKFKRSKRLDKEIVETKKAKNNLPKFKRNSSVSQPKAFQDYLIDTGFKPNLAPFKEKFVVFDVETNGTRKSNDDLLSLSIYDPSTGLCYNRFFPLDLQPLILTTFIHGITEKTLEGASHMTQEEMNQLIDFFDLKNSVLLSFSGGKGTFDSDFVINYCKRHGIHGFEDLTFRNIKALVPQAPYGCEGQLSKDNLCRILKIEGVTETHSGMNDCLLEWKLFEQLSTQPLFFVENNLYKFHDDYIIPITYMNKHPELPGFAGVCVPHVLGYVETVFEYKFPESVISSIRKFPTNITGITVENALDSLLGVKPQNNQQFLMENKRHLEFLGSLDSRMREIPIVAENDGTIRTTDPSYQDYIEEVNGVTRVIMNNLESTVSFLKKAVFASEQVISQELVISDDRKILALCDLSSASSVLEVKTFDILENDQYGLHITPEVSRQLYYERRGRSVYALSMIFETHLNRDDWSQVVDALSIRIYKVDLKEVEEIPPVFQIPSFARLVLEELIKDNSQTNSQLSEKTGLGVRGVAMEIEWLANHGYLLREGTSHHYGVWRVLKDADENPVPEEKQVKRRIIDRSPRYKDSVKKMTGGKVICVSYSDCRSPVDYECLVCGHKWSTRPEYFKHHQKHGCPKCKAGRGE